MTERDLAEMLRNNPDLRVEGNLITCVDTRPESSSNAAYPPMAPKLSEHDLQVAVIAECDLRAILRPEYGLIFAIPNGGKRSKAEGGRLKAEGVRAGMPDLFLPVARHGYHGLFIELKVGSGKKSLEQFKMFDRLQMKGYRVKVIWDDVAAVMAELEWYLEAA